MNDHQLGVRDVTSIPTSLLGLFSRIESQLDGAAADRNSLLQSSIRTLEILNGLEELTRRLVVNTRETHLLSLHDKPNHISEQSSNTLQGQDGASLEAFRSSRDLIVELHNELTRATQLNSEHLPQHLESSAFGSLNPELGLMIHLYSYLPVLTAIDVGANRGDISQQLLESGYELYAFEPSPQVFKELQDRLLGREQCHLYELGLGAADAVMQLHIAE